MSLESSLASHVGCSDLSWASSGEGSKGQVWERLQVELTIVGMFQLSVCVSLRLKFYGV